MNTANFYRFQTPRRHVARTALGMDSRHRRPASRFTGEL